MVVVLPISKSQLVVLPGEKGELQYLNEILVDVHMEFQSILKQEVRSLHYVPEQHHLKSQLFGLLAIWSFQ